ncbi:MAG: MerR family transcriptional regulator [Roseburia lenta]|nr:MerR family transcriptional regulator [Roseburia lenta]
MKIKQVEELVGITSKNIRFYEEQGLLQPRRTENGYRDYQTEDVELLKKIKLFRKLGVPVEQIHRLFQGQISVDECLENQKAVLQKEQDNIEKMCTLSQAMLAGSLSIEKLDSDYWLDEVEKMEKEGIDFVNVSKVDIHMKKKLGVFGGAGIMLIFMLLVIGVLIYGYVVDADMPLWALTLVIVPIVAVIVGTIVAMVSRIKEIDKGEEDEAAKY